MKQVKPRASVKDEAARIHYAHVISHLLLPKQNRPRVQGAKADREKPRNLPTAVDFTSNSHRSNLYSGFPNQLCNLDLAGITATPIAPRQSSVSSRPHPVEMGIPFWQPVGPPLLDTRFGFSPSTSGVRAEILGRTRVDINSQHYTIAERGFFEDTVLNIHPAQRAGIQPPGPGGAP